MLSDQEKLKAIKAITQRTEQEYHESLRRNASYRKGIYKIQIEQDARVMADNDQELANYLGDEILEHINPDELIEYLGAALVLLIPDEIRDILRGEFVQKILEQETVN